MFHRRRKGRQYSHRHLYNYYIIFTWTIFIITSGLSQQQQQQQQQHNDEGGQKKDEIKQAIRSNLLKLFNLKEVPKAPTNKAYIPTEMLREYMKYRDSVRFAIPKDEDFLGKITLNDLHPDDPDFMNQVTSRYGSGIEIDMAANEDEQLDKTLQKFYSMGQVDLVSAIPPDGDPEQIDPKLEPLLPPHGKPRQISSVHIRFNLSQHMYQKPYGPDKLRGAILKINREKLLDCHGGKCDRKLQQTADQLLPDETTSNGQKLNIATGNHYVPFYQRLFINTIDGYSEDGTPLSHTLHSQQLDTRYSTPITYDISGLVKEWLRNPEKNFGIIVRVTNDDPKFDKLVKQSNQLTNASTTTTTTTTKDAQNVVLEHVRLKRGFRSKSDTEDSWLRQQPSLTLYLDSIDETPRHNVRRADHPDQPDMDMEGAQADAPDPSVDSTSNDGALTKISSVNRSNRPTTRSTTNAPRLSSTNKQSSRQKDAKSQPSSRNQSNRNSAGSSQRSGGNKAQNTSKNTKCELSPLVINFDEVGWSNWIIAPSSYSAGLCRGECLFPLADHQNSTNHAIIQAIFNSVGRVVPRTCCAPTKLGRMAILFQLERSVQMKFYDDMIVEWCGCL